MSDLLDIILARITPDVAPLIRPVLDTVRMEHGGREHYIFSSRPQRQQAIREALKTEGVQEVAKRFRVSRRTAERLQRKSPT